MASNITAEATDIAAAVDLLESALSAMKAERDELADEIIRWERRYWAETERQWQPMATAPRDGTWSLLAWREWHHVPHAGYWSGYEWVFNGGAMGEGNEPDAWMPLPAPPSGGETG